MSVPFGVGKKGDFASLLGDPGVAEWPEPASDLVEPQREARGESPLIPIMREVAVLGEIIRKSVPIGVDEDGKMKFASPGEFNDIKDGVRKQLFAPPVPANAVTRDDLQQLVALLRAEIDSLREEVKPAPVSAEKPAPAKKGGK